MRLLGDISESFINKAVFNKKIDLSDVRLYFVNTDDFSSFPFPQKRAKSLIDHRKKGSGKINRSLPMQVQFVVKEIANEDWLKNHQFSDNSVKVLLCEIKRVDRFEDKKKEMNYLFTVEK